MEAIAAAPASNLQNFNSIVRIFKLNNFAELLQKEHAYLFSRINLDQISETLIQQIANETSRFGFLVEVKIYFFGFCESAQPKLDDSEFEGNKL